MAGAGVQFGISETLSLRTQAIFERRSTMAEITVTDVTGIMVAKVTHRYSWDYLTMPVFLRASFGENIKFFGQVGPYVSYLLDHSTSAMGASFPPAPADKRLFNDLDMGVCAGLGVTAPLTEHIGLSLEARNFVGLSNISAVPVYNNGALLFNSTSLVFGLVITPGKL